MRALVLALIIAAVGFTASVAPPTHAAAQGAQTPSASQAAVQSVYPQAVCVMLPNDTKWKVFATPSADTPIGYGVTQDAAWADAAGRLPK